MAGRDYDYGGEGGWRERDSSIFSDDNRDDRWRRGSERWSRGSGRDDERGFFERAGDEVRSWFGDEEAERRRERDFRRDEARGSFGRDEDRSRSRSSYGPGGYGEEEAGRGAFGWGSEYAGSARGASGRSGYGGSRSQYDDNYRRWRERQLEQFDREYEDYCRERQQKFETDFDSWRTSRLTEGGMSGGTGGNASATSRSLGSEGAGSTTAGGGGSGSATTSSTGSTGAAETGRGRGRSRS